MAKTQPHVNRRQLYTQTLMRDPRWKGPFLAVALMFGIQTGPGGEGRRFLIARNADAFGVARRGVHQIVRALMEQGYIIRAGEDEDAVYQLAAIRPALEMDEAMIAGQRSRTWTDPGPASRWLAAETSAWTRFQIDREQVWREQAAADPEYWNVGVDPGSRPALTAEDAA